MCQNAKPTAQKIKTLWVSGFDLNGMSSDNQWSLFAEGSCFNFSGVAI